MSAVMDDEDERASPSPDEFIAEIKRLVGQIRAKPGSRRKRGLLVLKKDANKIPQEWDQKDD